MKFGINIALALMMATSPLLAADDDMMSAKTFAGMKVRNIGPAYMSGRVADIAVDQNRSFHMVCCHGLWWCLENSERWYNMEAYL